MIFVSRRDEHITLQVLPSVNNNFWILQRLSEFTIWKWIWKLHFHNLKKKL